MVYDFVRLCFTGIAYGVLGVEKGHGDTLYAMSEVGEQHY